MKLSGSVLKVRINYTEKKMRTPRNFFSSGTADVALRLGPEIGINT